MMIKLIVKFLSIRTGFQNKNCLGKYNGNIQYKSATPMKPDR